MSDTYPDFEVALAKTFHASRYAAQRCAARPELADELKSMGNMPFDFSALKFTPDTKDALQQSLRNIRQRLMLRLIFRDINGLATLNEVMQSISRFAEIAIQTALAFHHHELSQRHGIPIGETSGNEQELLVVGMGKLGGMELNVSSDIDLIFVYSEEGETNGAKPVSNHDYFSRLGKLLIATLHDVTADGFVFRVDMRLRPFGDSGPLVSSFDALENYFYTQARPWERYAWLKARAITGLQANSALMKLVNPFVYRRYHDYGAIEEMRSLHGQIRAEATKRNRLDDIKVGMGGIREVEFIVQIFQLIRGGRETVLQSCSTLSALNTIGNMGLLMVNVVAQLREAYCFLRNLEHRLQYLDDQQTQKLPTNVEDQSRIASAMGFATFKALTGALNLHRDIVSREFEALFAQASTQISSSPVMHSDIDGIRQRIAKLEYDDTQSALIVERISAWLDSQRMKSLPEKTRAHLLQLLPLALEAVANENKQAATLFRILDLLEAIDKRSAYLALLIEYPDTLQRLARVAAKSPWAAELVRRHPVLLDELIGESSTEKIDWVKVRTQLQRDLDAAQGDLERQYDLLRHAKQIQTLHLNIADLEGKLDVMALSDELSMLADMLLDIALVMAWRTLKQGVTGDWSPPPGFALIGYGKLGSKELGYASDLDIIFLYADEATVETDLYTRLAQRLNNWLNTLTPAGLLYETDLRLRPDGVSGLLVSSLSAYRDYQLKRAWTWEHQALTRARFSAGDRQLEAQFETLRNDILCMPRDMIKLRDEIIEMRNKMRSEKPDRGDKLDLKHTQGGIIDVEFIVQFIVLAYAAQHAQLAKNIGNVALLKHAVVVGLLTETQATGVANAYLAYRARQHLARNNNEAKTLIAKDALLAEREAVKTAWLSVFGQ